MVCKLCTNIKKGLYCVVNVVNYCENKELNWSSWWHRCSGTEVGVE